MESGVDFMERKLKEIIKEKEKSDRLLLNLEWVIVIFSLIFLLVPIIIGSYLAVVEPQKSFIVFIGFIPAGIGIYFSMKIEQIAGYYKCKNCGHTYVPSFKSASLASHMGRTKYMKCPKCNTKSWQKKVLNKEM